MTMRSLFATTLIIVSFGVVAQPDDQMRSDQDYYYEIPDYPEAYTATAVAARMVDGLGFRFYWASEGLYGEELSYRPSPEGRNIDETLDHMYGLSDAILNAVSGKTSVRPLKEQDWTYKEKRAAILENIKKTSELLKADDPKNMKDYAVVFQNGDNRYEYPFWNMINGPIADAIYHTGQIVLLRRAAGNPINPNISVLRGSVRDPK